MKNVLRPLFICFTTLTKKFFQTIEMKPVRQITLLHSFPCVYLAIVYNSFCLSAIKFYSLPLFSVSSTLAPKNLPEKEKKKNLLQSLKFHSICLIIIDMHYALQTAGLDTVNIMRLNRTRIFESLALIDCARDLYYSAHPVMN